MSSLRRLAADAPAPVFVATGDVGRRAVRAVLADPRLTLTASPRHATVLLVAGAIPRADQAALAHVHDQLPHPRAVVWASWSTPPQAFVSPTLVGTDGDVAAAILAAHREVVRGERDSSPRLLPADHPVNWRGAGDHGQGGEGMMGGTPYGRPMAMTGPDPRDGLQLDRVPLSIGPFLGPWWPPGLRLELELQGDLVAASRVAASRPFDDVLDGADVDGYGAHGEPPDVVAEVLLALGHRSLARRWCRTGRGEATLEEAVRRALRGVPRGVGASEHDGRDVTGRVQAALAGADPVPGGETVLPHLLPGLAWRAAALTIASLGIDLRRPGPGDGPTPRPGAPTVALGGRR